MKYSSDKRPKKIVLKARQLGFTTYECIDTLDECLFNENFNGGIIAHDMESMEEIFTKIKLAWEHFPLKSLGWEANTERANQLSFNNGSKARVALSFRSATLNKLHVSELGKISAKYPNKAKEIISGSFESVPKGGRISVESTAEGEYGYFYDLFWDAWDELNDFSAHFYPWHEHDEYQVDVVDVPEDLKKYQSLYNLTDRQISWYYKKWTTSKDLMKQENPTTPEEAFESSSGKVFNADFITEMLQVTETGVKVGNWVYYEDFIPNHDYGLGADVAEGIGRDYSTIIIIDFSRRNMSGVIIPKVVARFKSNTIDPTMFAYEIKTGGNKYGACIAAVERNNHGHATLARLQDIYPNIYSQDIQIKDNVVLHKSNKLGWLTTSSSKPQIIFALKRATEEYSISIPDRAVLRELKMYDDNALKTMKYDEELTNHFDLVIALAIAYEMRNECVSMNSVQIINDETADMTAISEF